jgi:hypothetical protein
LAGHFGDGIDAWRVVADDRVGGGIEGGCHVGSFSRAPRAAAATASRMFQ